MEINCQIKNSNKKIDIMETKIFTNWTKKEILIFYLSFHKQMGSQFVSKFIIFILGKKMEENLSINDYINKLNIDIDDNFVLTILISENKNSYLGSISKSAMIERVYFLQSMFNDYMKAQKYIIKIGKESEYLETKKLELEEFVSNYLFELYSIKKDIFNEIKNTLNIKFYYFLKNEIFKEDNDAKNKKILFNFNLNNVNNNDNVNQNNAVIQNLRIIRIFFMLMIFFISIVFFYRIKDFYFLIIQFAIYFIINIAIPIIKNIIDKYNKNIKQQKDYLKYLKIEKVKNELKKSKINFTVFLIISFTLSIFTKIDKNNLNNFIYTYILKYKLLQIIKKYETEKKKELESIFREIEECVNNIKNKKRRNSV